ncbi:PF06257 domain protein [Peptoniphilus sp. BV3C26]|nr:PF06257 domain protein [Peptoniphilus sp. BV3C26]
MYPSLFVVEVENGIEMTTSSYTYSDVLTSTVMISVIEDDIDLEEYREKIS